MPGMLEIAAVKFLADKIKEQGSSEVVLLMPLMDAMAQGKHDPFKD
jgi:hypothetical protein